MAKIDPVFLVGEKAPPQPLGRFLPPLADRVFSAWLSEHVPAGSLILDPFGAAPRQCVEIARAGYRLICAANNPINRFLIEIYAQPPSRADLQAALAQLASQRVADQRLEPYIQELYQTECASCDQPTIARAFIWNKGENTPEARRYTCPNCGQNGEFPTTEKDRARARKIAATFELHKARALERVAGMADPDRSHVEEALAVYLPRAVLALFTVINKLDGLFGIDETQKNHLRALLLFACDEANALWPEDGSRQRPKQLTLPGRFVEKNLWLALEAAVALWSSDSAPVPLAYWSQPNPELPPGSLALFEGPVRELSSQLQALDVQAVATTLPRPNQAFWTLSALWSGWLWGREAVGPFRSVLRRRRYDWNWHTAALSAALQHLSPNLRPGIPWLGLIGEHEPGFLAAALTAAAAAGLELQGLAVREQSDQAQIHWQTPEKVQASHAGSNQASDPIIIHSARNVLLERGEPASYSIIHAAALRGLAFDFAFPIQAEDVPQGQALTIINQALQKNLNYQHQFLRFGGSAQNLETGTWWLREAAGSHAPLADRVEVALVTRLIEQPQASYRRLEQAACQAFPGLQTPDPELVEAILNSYTEPEPDNPSDCRLRPEDFPEVRNQDIRKMRQTLETLGQALGFKVEGQQPLTWQPAHQEPPAETAWRFYFQASANISKYLLDPAIPPHQSVLVLPGGRANLVMYRLQRDANLAQAYQKGWRFLKFRQVLRMAEDQSLDQDGFWDYLEIDPLTYTAPQMRLF
jgi:hypothetical protein